LTSGRIYDVLESIGRRMWHWSSTRTRRNSAVALLLLWVFAIANACAFDSPTIGAHLDANAASIRDAGDATMAPVVRNHVATGIAVDTTRSNRSQEACVDTYDIGPLSAVGNLPEAGSEKPLGLSPAVTQLTVARPIDLVQSLIDNPRPLETAVPLRTRYVRLAL